MMSLTHMPLPSRCYCCATVNVQGRTRLLDDVAYFISGGLNGSVDLLVLS